MVLKYVDLEAAARRRLRADFLGGRRGPRHARAVHDERPADQERGQDSGEPRGVHGAATRPRGSADRIADAGGVCGCVRRD